ncbi:hypothetical protein ROU88_08175 [Macrococcus capreoli]
MKNLLSCLLMFSIALSACGSHQDETKNDTETDQKEEKVNKSPEITLNEKTKLALAFIQKGADKYTISGKEILTGKYMLNVPPAPQEKKFHRLILSPVSDNTIPEGVKVYQIYPGKSNFISFIALTDKETIVGGTQNGYQDVLTSKEYVRYNTEASYKEKKHLTSLKELADILEIGNQPSYNAFKQQETLTSQTARERMYNQIMVMEGTKELNPQFVWDDIKLDKNNAYYVNYRNQDLEILGTYKTVNGKLVKEAKETN